MSLQVDAIILKAIEADATIMQMIGNRRWCTAAAMPEDDFLRDVAVPYIIVNFDGLTCDQGTKDDPFDSGEDRVNVSVTIAAQNSEQLADLASRVRRAVHSYLTTHMGEDSVPYETVFGAGRKFYDEWKPAYCIDLTWQCDCDFDLNGNDDEQESTAEI